MLSTKIENYFLAKWCQKYTEHMQNNVDKSIMGKTCAKVILRAD